MKIVIVGLCLILTGCDQMQKAPAQANFQIVSASDGNAWELNTQTGDVKFCTTDNSTTKAPVCTPVPSGKVFNYDSATGKINEVKP